jgi:hypothetical protein
MSRNSTGKMIASPQKVMVTKEELQERWKHLELKPATLLHLQEVLDTSGIAAAVIVTAALEREKKKQVSFTHIGKEWGFDALRLLSLEEIRPHLLNLFRVVLESFLAWHLTSLSSLSDGARDNIMEILLAAVFLLVSLCGSYLACLFCDKLSVSDQRKKSV